MLLARRSTEDPPERREAVQRPHAGLLARALPAASTGIPILIDSMRELCSPVFDMLSPETMAASCAHFLALGTSTLEFPLIGKIP
jgi:hypothetical protein